jgi:hypothetical protein
LDSLTSFSLLFWSEYMYKEHLYSQAMYTYSVYPVMLNKSKLRQINPRHKRCNSTITRFEQRGRRIGHHSNQYFPFSLSST